MRFFKGRVSVSITEDGVSVENSNEDFALTMVSFWAQTFNQGKEEPKPKPLGFSNDHVTEVESVTDRLQNGPDEDYDEDDDD